MDERELNSRIKALNKAVTENEPPTSIMSILNGLKKEAAPSEEMLRVS
jgi:transcription elongation factor S-II